MTRLLLACVNFLSFHLHILCEPRVSAKILSPRNAFSGCVWVRGREKVNKSSLIHRTEVLPGGKAVCRVKAAGKEDKRTPRARLFAFHSQVVALFSSAKHLSSKKASRCDVSTAIYTRKKAETNSMQEQKSFRGLSANGVYESQFTALENHFVPTNASLFALVSLGNIFVFICSVSTSFVCRISLFLLRLVCLFSFASGRPLIWKESRIGSMWMHWSCP